MCRVRWLSGFTHYWTCKSSDVQGSILLNCEFFFPSSFQRETIKTRGIELHLQSLRENWAIEENSSLISGSVHPTLTVAHTSYSCHDVLEKKSTESSPSHSQMSRNSSRKSNNSLLVNNGKYEGELLSTKKQFFCSVS